MKKFLGSIILVVLALGLSGSSSFELTTLNHGFSKTSAQTGLDGENIEKEFKAAPGQMLKIDLETGGSIEIMGWDKDLVKVTVLIDGRDTEDVEFEFEETTKGIEIISDYYGRNRNRSIDIELIVKVPKVFNIDFETAGGSVKIDGVEGELQGETMGGSLDLLNLKGNVSMTTMGGSIELSNCEIDGNVKTMGGSVSLENVIGDVDAETMGGSIEHKNVKGRIDPDGKVVKLSTMGGSISVDEAPNGLNVKTMGGNIQIKSAGKFVEAETMGGQIEVEAVDGGIKAKTMGGDVYVTMIGDPAKGDRDVAISSMGGDIELTVPAGLSMNVDIEIAYTKKYEDDVEIVSNFNIEQEKSKGWENDHGSKRKFLYGKATIGDGKNSIKIRTVNGVVKLKTK
ncbi:MAG: hypothetical protein V1720_21045 [bacterium]